MIVHLSRSMGFFLLNSGFWTKVSHYKYINDVKFGPPTNNEEKNIKTSKMIWQKTHAWNYNDIFNFAVFPNKNHFVEE